MLNKMCVVCPIYAVCEQAFTKAPCPVEGATEEDTVKMNYEED